MLHLCSILLLTLLSGCRPSLRRAQQKPLDSGTEIFEARHADLPFPIGSQIVLSSDEEEQDGQQKLCEYTIAQNFSWLIDFYEKEMERWGWQQLLAAGDEKKYLFVFQKPGKRCVAIHLTTQHSRLRNKNRSVVSLFLQ